MAKETGIAAVVGGRYRREAEARVMVEACRTSGEELWQAAHARLEQAANVLQACHARPASRASASA
jgi:hypothetical protein